MDTSLYARVKRFLDDNSVDTISKLPCDLLTKIIANLSTKEAIMTSVLSKQWSGVWKHIPSLVFDMKRYCFDHSHNHGHKSLYAYSNRVAELITKVMNGHNGHLEMCVIHHYSYQVKNGTLENWIFSLIHEKHVKYLQLENIDGYHDQNILHLPPNTFSHLETLLLGKYEFQKAHAFNNCYNLKVLKLARVYGDVDVFNTVIALCPSLKVLMLEMIWYKEEGCLKIHSDNLKLLQLKWNHVGSIEVRAPLLDIFSVFYAYGARFNSVIIDAPRLSLIPNIWNQDEMTQTILYNVSDDIKEETNFGHKFVVNRFSDFSCCFNSLVVMVNLMNPREVQMFKEVLVAWHTKIMLLNILFKDNKDAADEEVKSSISRVQRKKFKEIKMIFNNIDFRVEIVKLLNFDCSNKEQFGLASLFITQGTVRSTMWIKTSTVLVDKKFEMNAAMTKLMKLPKSKGNKRLRIKCY